MLINILCLLNKKGNGKRFSTLCHNYVSFIIYFSDFWLIWNWLLFNIYSDVQSRPPKTITSFFHWLRFSYLNLVHIAWIFQSPQTQCLQNLLSLYLLFLNTVLYIHECFYDWERKERKWSHSVMSNSLWPPGL